MLWPRLHLTHAANAFQLMTLLRGQTICMVKYTLVIVICWPHCHPSIPLFIHSSIRSFDHAFLPLYSLRGQLLPRHYNCLLEHLPELQCCLCEKASQQLGKPGQKHLCLHVVQLGCKSLAQAIMLLSVGNWLGVCRCMVVLCSYL